MYISYGSTDPSIVRYFSKRVPRSLSTTSGQFVIDSATVAAWSLTSPSSSRPAKVKFPEDPEGSILSTQSNLAKTYSALGREEQALGLKRDVYSTCLMVLGGEHERTFIAANNCADSCTNLKLFKEAKSLMRKMIPVARRVLGESYDLTLRMRWNYAEALYMDPDATLDDLHEAVTTLEEIERTARRVLGGANPLTRGIEFDLRKSRFALRVRETPPGTR